jgi:hypothetical protein
MIGLVTGVISKQQLDSQRATVLAQHRRVLGLLKSGLSESHPEVIKQKRELERQMGIEARMQSQFSGIRGQAPRKPVQPSNKGSQPARPIATSKEIPVYENVIQVAGRKFVVKSRGPLDSVARSKFEMETLKAIDPKAYNQVIAKRAQKRSLIDTMGVDAGEAIRELSKHIHGLIRGDAFKISKPEELETDVAKAIVDPEVQRRNYEFAKQTPKKMLSVQTQYGSSKVKLTDDEWYRFRNSKSMDEQREILKQLAARKSNELNRAGAQVMKGRETMGSVYDAEQKGIFGRFQYIADLAQDSTEKTLEYTGLPTIRRAIPKEVSDWIKKGATKVKELEDNLLWDGDPNGAWRQHMNPAVNFGAEMLGHGVSGLMDSAATAVDPNATNMGALMGLVDVGSTFVPFMKGASMTAKGLKTGEKFWTAAGKGIKHITDEVVPMARGAYRVTERAIQAPEDFRHFRDTTKLLKTQKFQDIVNGSIDAGMSVSKRDKREIASILNAQHQANIKAGADKTKGVIDDLDVEVVKEISDRKSILYQGNNARKLQQRQDAYLRVADSLKDKVDRGINTDKLAKGLNNAERMLFDSVDGNMEKLLRKRELVAMAIDGKVKLRFNVLDTVKHGMHRLEDDAPEFRLHGREGIGPDVAQNAKSEAALKKAKNQVDDGYIVNLSLRANDENVMANHGLKSIEMYMETAAYKGVSKQVLLDDLNDKVKSYNQLNIGKKRKISQFNSYEEAITFLQSPGAQNMQKALSSKYFGKGSQNLGYAKPSYKEMIEKISDPRYKDTNTFDVVAMGVTDPQNMIRLNPDGLPYPIELLGKNLGATSPMSLEDVLGKELFEQIAQKAMKRGGSADQIRAAVGLSLGRRAKGIEIPVENLMGLAILEQKGTGKFANAGYDRLSHNMQLAEGRANKTSVIHELVHHTRMNVGPKDKEFLAKKFGHLSADELEEKIARGIERVIYEGESPNRRMKRTIKGAKKDFRSEYGELKGSAIGEELDPEFREFLMRQLGGADYSMGLRDRSMLENAARVGIQVNRASKRNEEEKKKQTPTWSPNASAAAIWKKTHQKKYWE